MKSLVPQKAHLSRKVQNGWKVHRAGVREVSQPFTWCCDPRLWRSGQGDWDTRAHWRFQRLV